MATRTASCSCGQLRIDVTGESNGVGICHCLACQRRTGSVFATLASFSAPYLVSGRSTAYAHTGDAGGEYVFHFCPACGTTLYHTEDGVQDEVLVAVGAFADPGFPAPAISVYESRMHAWVVPPGGAEHYP